MRQSVRFAVLERDQFRCRYCGRPASETLTLQVDHIHPRSKGGTDEMTNLVTACWECNIVKGARVLRPIPPRKPRGPRMPSVGPTVLEAEEAAAELDALARRFPVGSHCSTPLKIAAMGAQFGIASYASAYKFVKSLPAGAVEVPMPPQRKSDADWMRVVAVDPIHQEILVAGLARALDRA